MDECRIGRIFRATLAIRCPERQGCARRVRAVSPEDQRGEEDRGWLVKGVATVPPYMPEEATAV